MDKVMERASFIHEYRVCFIPAELTVDLQSVRGPVIAVAGDEVLPISEGPHFQKARIRFVVIPERVLERFCVMEPVPVIRIISLIDFSNFKLESAIAGEFLCTCLEVYKPASSV